jgi:hypothetical protein
MNDYEKLIDRKCIFSLSDPWDMGEAIQWREMTGVIVGVEQRQGSIILELDRPFTYKSVLYEYLLVSTRHEGGTFTDCLSKGLEVPANSVQVLRERIWDKTPEIPDSFRQGRGMISSLKIF